MNRNLSLLATLVAFISYAQDRTYDYASIPDSLKEHANAVIRYENTSVQIKNASEMVISNEMIVTILNEKGESFGRVNLYYDSHSKIKNVSVRVLDAFGKAGIRIKKSDFNDVSASGGANLYSDNRLLYYHHNANRFPYTLHIIWEMSSSNTAFLPGWDPVPGYFVSTEQSKIEMVFPPELSLKHKGYNLENYQFDLEEESGMVSYSLANAKALEREAMSPYIYEFKPSALFSVNEFSLAGEKGKAENWLELGKWWNENLMLPTQGLPKLTEESIHAMVAKVDDPKEKARRIYEFMQDKTRYVSIQIGIGGWKPMTVQQVDELGYGDCKALTNYTQALLKAAGIPSYHSMIYAGKGEHRTILDKVPSQLFNHDILMVPFKKDTVWLECTNQKIPFGHLGSFTDNRESLVLTPEGGKVVRTRGYGSQENSQKIKGSVALDAEGNIKASVDLEREGMQFDRSYYVIDMDEREKEKYYKNLFDQINSIKLLSTEANMDKDLVRLNEKVSFIAQKYAAPSNDEMLFRLNVFNTYNYIPKRDRNRKLPLEIKYGYADQDEVFINLPENYAPTSLPDPIVLDSKFGTYEVSVEKLDNNELRYQRRIMIKQGTYKTEDYEAYRKFKKKINQMDQLKILLTKTQKT